MTSRSGRKAEKIYDNNELTWWLLCSSFSSYRADWLKGQRILIVFRRRLYWLEYRLSWLRFKVSRGTCSN